MAISCDLTGLIEALKVPVQPYKYGRTTLYVRFTMYCIW